MNKLRKPGVLAIWACLLIVNGCGMAASDAERIERARSEMATGAYRAAVIELKNVLSGNASNAEARLLLAEVSLGLDDIDTAEKELTRAAELGANESDIRSLHLKLLLAKSDYEGVLSSLGMDEGGLAEEAAWSARGRALLGIGNTDAAEATYREWLASDAASVDASLGLADVMVARGDSEAAIALLEQVVAEAPESYSAWKSLGNARRQAGDLESAEVAYATAEEKIRREANVRDYGSIQASLADVRMSLNKLDEARLSLNRLSGIYPSAPPTLLLSARLARLERDYAQASRHLQTLLNIDADNTQAQLLLANMQMMQGNYAQAESLLTRVVARSPDNVQARKLLAQVQLRRSRPEGAVEALAPILSDLSDDREVYELLAQVNLQEGDTRAAIENFRSIVEKAPDDMFAKLNLAAAYLSAGEPELALEVIGNVPEDFNSGFRRDALLMAALVQRGETTAAEKLAESLLEQNAQEAAAIGVAVGHFIASGNLQRAEQVLEQRVASAGEDVAAILALARIKLDGGDLDAAVGLFTKVEVLQKNNLAALMGLARINELQGDQLAADELLLRAIAVHPADVRPKIWLASRYLAAEKIQEAEKLTDEAVSLGIRGARMSQIAGRIFIAAGRMEDALVQFDTAAKLAQDLPTVQWDLARTYLALDRTVEAKAALEQALAIDPDWIPAKATLALVELRQGNVNAAMRHVSELKAAHPNNASIHVLEGEVSLYQGDYAAAAQAFSRAVANGAGKLAMLKEFQARANGRLPDPAGPVTRWLSNNPEDLGIRMLLAEYYQRADDRAAAIGEYERILKQDAENVPALNNLAWQYQQRGNLDRAVGLAEQAYALDPNSGSIVDTLGWIYRDMDRADDAKRLLGQAARLSPDNGEILYHLAVVLAETGDKNAARDILLRLKDGNTEFPSRLEAQELLGKL